MKKYLLTQERMTYVFPVLLNVGMMLVLLIGSAAFPTNARAASIITVNSTADTTTSGDGCTLREAITNANANAATYGDCVAGSGNDAIVFASSLGTATITLSSTLPEITGSSGLTIDGDNRITLSGNDSVQVLYMAYGLLTLKNISVTHGKAATYGGGLWNYEGTLTIVHSTFSNNSATGNTGGGVMNQGTATIIHSTFSNNSANYEGGGIENATGSTLTIVNSTFSNNSANYGGGVMNNAGTATILNSTFSNNSATSDGGGVATYDGGNVDTPATTTIRNTILANGLSGGDCWNWPSGILIGGNNIIEESSTCTSIATITSDPKLGSLTSSPAYFPLNAGSPAIDTGDNAICASTLVRNTSQNGLTRPQGAYCDIGSYEFVYKLFLPLLLR